jgi:hypothetical protein
MKELVQYAFDFFAHVLPGLFIIFSLSLLIIVDAITFEVLIEKTKDVYATVATVVVIIAYVIGFAVNPFGKFLYRKLGFKIWKYKIENNIDMFISDKFALVRQFSPKNFEYIEKWNTYCSMSHNLSVASLVMVVVGIIKIIQIEPNWLIWSAITAISIILFFIFLYRAVLFSIWAGHDLNAAISRLSLSDKELI